MRDVNEHATHSAAAQDQDSGHPPQPGRRRDDPTPPDPGIVNPQPPQRGGDGPSRDTHQGRRRGDPTPPDPGLVNPQPPQLGE
jgi:hypothetical protein